MNPFVRSENKILPPPHKKRSCLIFETAPFFYMPQFIYASAIGETETKDLLFFFFIKTTVPFVKAYKV